MVERIANEITDQYEREVPAEVIGKLVMDGLRSLDQVAYVRFASVYRQFADLQNFMQELEALMKSNR